MSKFIQAVVVVGCFFVGVLCMLAARPVWQSAENVQLPRYTLRELIAQDTGGEAAPDNIPDSYEAKKVSIEKAQQKVKRREKLVPFLKSQFNF